jgi:hypothetical protein
MQSRVTSCRANRLSVRMSKLLIGLAVVSSLLAQRPGTRMPVELVPQPPGTQTGAASVRGAVVGSGGEPLRKAEVTLRGSGRGGGIWVHTTDATGTFSFDALPSGSYTISVQRTGYVRTSYGGRPGARDSGSAITLAEDQRVTGITVKLIPHAVIAGKVLDEDAEPLMHASVQLLRERWINGRRQLVPAGADSTNDLGEYRIPGMAAGRYYVMASFRRPMVNPSLRRGAEDGSELNYAPVFYPGVNEVAQATPVALSEGQQMLGIDLQIRKLETYNIRGNVVDESGRPVIQATVMAVPVDGYAGVRAMGMVRNPEGVFEIPNVTPGSYTLVVNRTGRGEPRMTGQLPLQVGNGNVEGVTLQLAPPFDISGQVKFASEGADVTNVRVALEPVQFGTPFFGGTNSEMTPDGQFRITGVSPGKYRFVVQRLPEGAYVKGVSVQGLDITAGASINSAATGVEITLGANAPEVTGTVLNKEKQPLPETSVVLVPEDSKAGKYWLFRTASSDQNGAFVFRNVVPGQYTAYAFTEAEEGAWQDPDFLKQYAGKGTAVKLAEGSNEALQLVASP